MPVPPPTATDATQADIALLDRVTGRDASALAELYDRHSRLLFGLLLRILRSREESEEVLQEVFVQAWTKSATYHRSLGTPAGWLVGIARNRAIDRLRASGRRPAAVDEESAVSPAASPEIEAAQGERQIDVRRALDALPLDQRVLIEDAYFLGFTHSELAERHRLPLGTVKTRIRAAMQTLRGYLEGRYVEQ